MAREEQKLLTEFKMIEDKIAKLQIDGKEQQAKLLKLLDQDKEARDELQQTLDKLPLVIDQGAHRHEDERAVQIQWHQGKVVSRTRNPQQGDRCSSTEAHFA